MGMVVPLLLVAFAVLVGLVSHARARVPRWLRLSVWMGCLCGSFLIVVGVTAIAVQTADAGAVGVADSTASGLGFVGYWIGFVLQSTAGLFLAMFSLVQLTRDLQGMYADSPK